MADETTQTGDPVVADVAQLAKDMSAKTDAQASVPITPALQWALDRLTALESWSQMPAAHIPPEPK